MSGRFPKPLRFGHLGTEKRLTPACSRFIRVRRFCAVSLAYQIGHSVMPGRCGIFTTVILAGGFSPDILAGNISPDSLSRGFFRCGIFPTLGIFPHADFSPPADFRAPASGPLSARSVVSGHIRTRACAHIQFSLRAHVFSISSARTRIFNLPTKKARSPGREAGLFRPISCRGGEATKASRARMFHPARPSTRQAPHSRRWLPIPSVGRYSARPFPAPFSLLPAKRKRKPQSRPRGKAP